jgi:hypothetical protein
MSVLEMPLERALADQLIALSVSDSPDLDRLGLLERSLRQTVAAIVTRLVRHGARIATGAISIGRATLISSIRRSRRLMRPPHCDPHAHRSCIMWRHIWPKIQCNSPHISRGSRGLPKSGS